MFYERTQNDDLIIYLKGELGNFEAKNIMKEIESLLLLYPKSNIILDLEKLTFMDSSGIAVVMRTLKSTQGKREFKVQNSPNLAMKIFRASGLNKFVNFA